MTIEPNLTDFLRGRPETARRQRAPGNLMRLFLEKQDQIQIRKPRLCEKLNMSYALTPTKSAIEIVRLPTGQRHCLARIKQTNKLFPISVQKIEVIFGFISVDLSKGICRISPKTLALTTTKLGKVYFQG